MKNIRRISTILLCIVFLSPVLGTLVSAIGQSTETNQYSILQWALMGIYNLPFFIVSLMTLILGDTFAIKQKYQASGISFSISIVSSTFGTILMLVWGLGGL